MRRGYDNKLWIEDGKLIGVSLGADYTSEHEWGIDTIRSYFDIPNEGFGIERRQIKKCPGNLIYLQDKTNDYLFFNNFWLSEKGLRDILKGIGREVLPIQEKSGIGSAWSGGNFGVAFNKDTRKFVPELIESFTNLDIMIGFAGKSGPFSNPGLFIGIVSRLPKEWLQEMYDADKDLHDRNDHPEHKRITSLLKESKKRFMALSPSWADEDKKELKWWLNPMDQQNNNYGWYGIEELELWAKDQGPIPKVASE